MLTAARQSVIGSMLLSPEIIGDVVRRLSPEDFGLKRSPHDELLGGGPQENAAITRAVLSGQQKGARRDAVLLNAGAGLYTVKKVKTIEDGMEMAAQAIDSGDALRTLDRYVALTGAS